MIAASCPVLPRDTPLNALEDQDVVVHVPRSAEGTEINHFALYSRSDNVRVTSKVYCTRDFTVLSVYPIGDCVLGRQFDMLLLLSSISTGGGKLYVWTSLYFITRNKRLGFFHLLTDLRSNNT